MSVHQMSPTQQLRQQTSNCSSLLIYRPWKDERLSWPGWLTYSRWFTHISGHSSATGRAQDNESTPAKDRCSTTGPRNQLWLSVEKWCVWLAVYRSLLVDRCTQNWLRVKTAKWSRRMAALQLQLASRNFWSMSVMFFVSVYSATLL